jgi:hypothetical protein
VWRDLLWRDWSDLRDQVCRLVLGNLTAEEWSEYAPEVEPGATCPGA